MVRERDRWLELGVDDGRDGDGRCPITRTVEEVTGWAWGGTKSRKEEE